MGVIVLSILAVLVIGSLFRPLWALTLAMLMYPLEQSLQGSVAQFRAFPPLANYIVAVVVGIAAMRAVFRQQRPFLGYLSRAWIVTIAIYAWSAISLTWTPSMPQAGEMILEGLPYFILFIIAAPILIDGLDDLHALCGLTLVFGSLVAFTIIVNPEFNLKSGRLGLMLTSTVRSSPLAIGELGGTLLITSALSRASTSALMLKLVRPFAFVCGAVLALYSGSRGQLLLGAIFALGLYPMARPVRSLSSYVTSALGVLLVGGVLLYLAQSLLEGDMLRRWQGDVLSSGVEVRRLNTLDLVRAFASDPVAWIFGLGWNAFSSITDSSKEPYSHFLIIDLLTELGLPALVAFGFIAVDVFRSGRRLFADWAADEQRRAAITVFVALALYQFLLVNKQGYLWGVGLSFLYWLILVRVCTRSSAFGAANDG
jgi:hypothetical protein